MFVCIVDSGGMWDDVADEEDDEEEDEGLAGQLLSDLIASNKYGMVYSEPVIRDLHFVYLDQGVIACVKMALSYTNSQNASNIDSFILTT